MRSAKAFVILAFPITALKILLEVHLCLRKLLWHESESLQSELSVYRCYSHILRHHNWSAPSLDKLHRWSRRGTSGKSDDLSNVVAFLFRLFPLLRKKTLFLNWQRVNAFARRNQLDPWLCSSSPFFRSLCSYCLSNREDQIVVIEIEIEIFDRTTMPLQHLN